MEYLTFHEIQTRAGAIAEALERLLLNKAVVNKPRAKQWLFFRDCLEFALFPEKAETEHEKLTPVQAAQLKFEVEDRLKRYYLRPGKNVGIVFSMVHKKTLNVSGLPDGDTYPSRAGYCVLVRDLSAERRAEQESPVDLKPYLERVITECIDAEFRSYAALPEVDRAGLEKWFCPDGPAIKEIMNLLVRHQKRGWIISNSLNPSTKRLLNITVKKVERNEARVNTMEYWYLRWFDRNSGEYTYIYRETNRQMYILRKDSEGWRVFENLRPSPRTSLPHRWKNRNIKL